MAVGSLKTLERLNELPDKCFKIVPRGNSGYQYHTKWRIGLSTHSIMPDVWSAVKKMKQRASSLTTNDIRSSSLNAGIRSRCALARVGRRQRDPVSIRYERRPQRKDQIQDLSRTQDRLGWMDRRRQSHRLRQTWWSPLHTYGARPSFRRAECLVCEVRASRMSEAGFVLRNLGFLIRSLDDPEGSDIGCLHEGGTGLGPSAFRAAILRRQSQEWGTCREPFSFRAILSAEPELPGAAL